MRKYLKNIHFLFWGFIPIFLIYGFFIAKYDIDVNIHDWYFVISTKLLTLALSFLWFVIGLGYIMIYKGDNFKPINLLTIIHVVITMMALLAVVLTPKYNYELPVENFTVLKEKMDRESIYEAIRFNSLAIGFFSQFIFLLNLILGVFRK